ncbi:MAG: PAS domain S-box protein [Spirochaetales bacterium]|nr:PAS domain S-box protein [Spirochaetales bacterium]
MDKKEKAPYGSLRTKILVALVGISIVSTGITGWFIINLARDVIIWNIQQRNEQIARQASREISRYIENSVNNLKIISETIIPVFFDKWLLNMIIENMSLNLREFKTIMIADTKGAVYASSSLSNKNASITDEFVREHLESGSITISRLELYEGNLPYVTIVYPLTAGGRGRYVMVAELTLRSIWDLVDSITIGQKGDAYLIAADGTLIAYPDKTKVLSNIDFHELPPLPTSVPPDGISCFQHSSGLRGILMVYMEVQAAGWYIALRQPLEEAFLPVNTLVWWAFLVIGVLFVVIVFTALFLTRRFSRPLGRLMNVTRMIAKGNFDYMIPVVSSDEIGMLSHSFNTMVSELKQRSEALIESESKMRLITENVNDIIFSLDTAGNILFLNRQAEIASGYSRTVMMSRPLTSFLTDKSRKKIEAYLGKSVASRKEGMEEIGLVLAAKSGKKIYLEAKIVVVNDEAGERYFYGVARDITARKKTERKLHVYQNKLRSLSSQLTLAEEKERRNIAANLHDNISQSLSLALIKLDMLREVSPVPDDDTLIEEIRELVEETLKTSRSLTFDLSSPLLYQLGLEAAVEKLTEQIGLQHGLSIEFIANSRTGRHNTDIAVLLFRVIKELLINIVKHAHAENVKLFVLKKQDVLEITVRDDGVGFDGCDTGRLPDRRGGHGLFSIKERIRHLGGHVKIETIKNRGTDVTITIPAQK